MSRLSLSDTDKVACDWFVEETRQLGGSVTVDKMGNIFAVRPSRVQVVILTHSQLVDATYQFNVLILGMLTYFY